MWLMIVLEKIGTIAFAISGAFVAIGKKMDIFGVAMLGMTTAIGGGMIRDIILGTIPPTVFRDPSSAIMAVAVSLIVFIPAIRKRIKLDGKVLLVMDTIGLAIFTVIGVRAGIVFNNILLAVFMGMLTGVGGGILRDIFAGDRPYVFIKHFYANASIIGAFVTALIWPLGEVFAMIGGAVTVFVLRILAAKYRWSLPKA